MSDQNENKDNIEEVPFKELIVFYDGKKIRMNKGQGGSWYEEQGFKKVKIKMYSLEE